jgi:hypothetical protein
MRRGSGRIWQWRRSCWLGLQPHCIREPQVDRVRKEYKRVDYYRLVAVFFLSVVSFVLSYIYSGKLPLKC